MFKINQRLKSETDYGIFTIVSFSDDEFSGTISIVGDYTTKDKYTTSNAIVDTIFGRHKITPNKLTYIDAVQSKLTDAQKTLAKEIAFNENFENKDKLIQLLPKFATGTKYTGGTVLWAQYTNDDGNQIAIFYVKKEVPAGNAFTDPSVETSYFYPIWGTEYEGLY
ncbi:hypothetical protein AALH12_07565 [Streptococcus ferus]|uniref:hypothetical protein n=1 Tax=Streptococcus ferus TaxID=1345 RepID=UPI003517D97B